MQALRLAQDLEQIMLQNFHHSALLEILCHDNQLFLLWNGQCVGQLSDACLIYYGFEYMIESIATGERLIRCLAADQDPLIVSVDEHRLCFSSLGMSEIFVMHPLAQRMINLWFGIVQPAPPCLGALRRALACLPQVAISNVITIDIEQIDLELRKDCVLQQGRSYGVGVPTFGSSYYFKTDRSVNLTPEFLVFGQTLYYGDFGAAVALLQSWQ